MESGLQYSENGLCCFRYCLYGLRELFCGDDTEQLVAQAWVIRDGLSQLLGPSGIVHGPDDLWVVAASGGLFEAGGEVVLVVVGLGDQAAMRLAGEVGEKLAPGLLERIYQLKEGALAFLEENNL